MKRRIDALRSELGPVDSLSYTPEEWHRMLWKRNKQAYLELAPVGVRSAIFLQPVFEREDAAEAEKALLRKRGEIR